MRADAEARGLVIVGGAAWAEAFEARDGRREMVVRLEVRYECSRSVLTTQRSGE
jgi:hypothetical protein